MWYRDVIKYCWEPSVLLEIIVRGAQSFQKGRLPINLWPVEMSESRKKETALQSIETSPASAHCPGKFQHKTLFTHVATAQIKMAN